MEQTVTLTDEEWAFVRASVNIAIDDLIAAGADIEPFAAIYHKVAKQTNYDD